MAMIVLASTLGLVIDRHLIRSSFDAYDQISRLALVWMTFLGFFFALEEKANIHVEILDVILPARLKAFRSVVFGAIMLFISTLLFFKGWEAVRAGAAQQILGTPLSYAWSFSAIPVSMGLIVVFRTGLCARKAESFGPANSTSKKPSTGAPSTFRLKITAFCSTSPVASAIASSVEDNSAPNVTSTMPPAPLIVKTFTSELCAGNTLAAASNPPGKLTVPAACPNNPETTPDRTLE